MATDLRSNDTIQVRVPQGGGSVRDVPLSELNEYISTEEAAGITTLETYVGDYSSPAGGEGSDISTDLATVYDSVETAETRLGDLEAVAPQYVATFATATAAQGTLTLADNVTADDEVTIGSITYKFVAEPAAAYDVAIAGSASDTIDNLIAAITFDEGLGTNEGTAYGTGTVAHPDVTAAAGDNDTMTVTALVKGAAGNAIGTTDPTDDGDVIDFGAAALAGGIDGQVGATGKIIFTATGIYCCTDGTKCVITDSSGWKSADFS